MRTSLELSKKLAENGCELESDRVWMLANPLTEQGVEDFLMVKQIRYNHDTIRKEETWVCDRGLRHLSQETVDGDEYKAYSYDILNDICIKYAHHFFTSDQRHKDKIHYHIMDMIAKNVLTQKPVNDYIREHCLFNPKNKGGESK